MTYTMQQALQHQQMQMTQAGGGVPGVAGVPAMPPGMTGMPPGMPVMPPGMPVMPPGMAGVPGMDS